MSQFLVALSVASASASTKISTVALALSVHYSILIQIHHIFMIIATSINSGGDIYVHRQVNYGCFAHFCPFC